jgi:hypothetical protein
MKDSRAIATWLLERFRLDTGLAGDLLEERSLGRSAAWYWRQVLTAIAAYIVNDIYTHKAEMLGALMTGLGAETVLFGLYNAYVSPSLPVRPMLSPTSWGINLGIICVTQIATGWLVGRTHRRHRFSALLVLTTFTAAWWTYENLSTLQMLTANSIDQPRFRPYLAFHLSNIGVGIASMIIGGMLSGSGAGESEGGRVRTDPN